MGSVGRRRTHVGGPRSAAAVAGLGVVLAAFSAGCGAVDSGLPAAAEPLAPRPTPSLAAAPTQPAVPPDSCGDRTASWRPPSPLPAPEVALAQPAFLKVAERDYLTVGVRPDTPPFASVDPDTGAFEGFEIDMANLVGVALFGEEGHVQFRAIDSTQRVPLVASGDLDLTTGALTPTCERLEEIDFSVTYYWSARGVLVLRESDYQGLDDLGGRPVCAAAGTTSIQAVADAPSNPEPYPVADVSDCLIALQDGLVDGIVNDEVVLSGLQAQDPLTHVIDATVFDQPIAFGVGKDRPELAAFVNGVLERAFADGTWTRIYETWLDHLRAAPAPPTPSYRN